MSLRWAGRLGAPGGSGSRKPPAGRDEPALGGRA